jgi:hypothetical protein
VAQRITVVMLDDLTGEHGDDVDTVQFRLDGVDYEIDLSEPNAAKLRDLFGPYVEAGRRLKRDGSRTARTTRPPRARPPAPPPSSNGDGPRRTTLDPAIDPQRARKWAREQGYTVPQRGRLPELVTDAYRQHLASL